MSAGRNFNVTPYLETFRLYLRIFLYISANNLASTAGTKKQLLRFLLTGKSDQELHRRSCCWLQFFDYVENHSGLYTVNLSSTSTSLDSSSDSDGIL